MEQRGGASHSHRATELLRAWGAGDAAAFEQLIPLVHAELRRLARRYMGHERPGHTLQPTALVNEAYLRLVDLNQKRWQDRALDDALTQFAAVSPRKAQVVELRFFGGLSVEATAEALHVSPETVKRDWRLAKVWLVRQLSGTRDDG